MKIAVLRRINFLPTSILQTIYFKTVLPSVLYGIVIWGSCSPTLMEDIERAHIRATKLIYKLPKDTNANEFTKLKGWYPISYYYTKRLLVETYKAYHGSNIKVLNNLIKKKNTSYNLRKTMNIELPSPRTEIGRLSFRHRAALAWNALPDSIRTVLAWNHSKSNLKTIRT